MNTATLKAQCNKCLQETNHVLLHKEEQPWEEQVDDFMPIYGNKIFKMIKCLGCDSVKLMHQSWFSESADEQGDPITDTNYYPPAISRAEPKWLSDLGCIINSSEQKRYVSGLLKEIYSALYNDSRRLAVMGIRALIEHLMITEVEDKGTFRRNLEAFQEAGYLSTRQREIIEPILEAGHAAIHRGFHPSADDVITVVEITESLIETIYVHSVKAEKLRQRVPQRQR